MTQRSHPTPSVPAHTRASRGRILLLALLAMGCSGDDVTGPRAAAEPPPDDPMRLASMVITDAEMGAQTRHHFIYDDAGRLKRVDFFISEVRDGPPVWRTHYTEHTYAGSVLTETSHFRLTGTGEYANWIRIGYDYDRLGYLVRETVRRARVSDDPAEQRMVDTFTTRFRYDTRGRLAERIEGGGDRTIYSYDGVDGLLSMAEARSPGAETQRRTFSYAGGRNPFYRRVAHVNSLIVPIGLEAMLLAPANLARLENRVNPSPTLVASLTQEYRTDGEGRPVHIRQRFINDIHPESRGTVLLFDFDYEPAGG